MEYEIELKLLTNENAGEMIEKKLLPQLNATVTQDSLELTNHYFDSKNRILRRHDIGLRIRGNNHNFEQTLKTAGKSVGGLHQRPEYNVQLDLTKHNVTLPTLSLFPASAWPDTFDIKDLQNKVETLFTTHFVRKIYLLEFSNGDTVELVWDLGEVTSANKSVPICEIELELKKGSVMALFDLARRLVSLLPTSIGTDSKAARGYNLLDGLPVKKYQPLQQKLPENMQTEAKVFASLLTTQLQDFQWLCAEIRRQYSEVLANNIKQVLIALVDNVVKFKQHFPCPALSYIHTELSTLSNDWSLVTQTNNKDASIRLLTQAATTQLQLDIVQCLTEQSWSSAV